MSRGAIDVSSPSDVSRPEPGAGWSRDSWASDPEAVDGLRTVTVETAARRGGLKRLLALRIIDAGLGAGSKFDEEGVSGKHLRPVGLHPP